MITHRLLRSLPQSYLQEFAVSARQLSPLLYKHKAVAATLATGERSDHSSRGSVMSSSIKFLGQDQAKAVDEELMGPLGFSIDQLMELAGLSVASSILAEYPPSKSPRILIVAGPGNNGGDGLVAARHLYHFGYKGIQLFYPKQTDKPLYKGLVTQLKSLKIPMPSIDDIQAKPLREQFDVVVDSIFGFGFTGAPRPPFDKIIEVWSHTYCLLLVPLACTGAAAFC
ncbi:TPA: Pyridoxine/pyridoxamine 5'-phosphate oxidase 1, chloroplastic, variant 2 [Trebouxia sp. C0004]